MMNPYFSIIIPVYNVAPYLRECLDSVLAQTFTDWEAICVDDGSTDESGRIIDEYVARDARFKKVVKKNGGLASARNAAFPYLSGRWVGFLDSDDKIEREWLASAKVIADRDNPDMVRLSFKFWDPTKPEGAQVWNSEERPERLYAERRDVFRWGWEILINGGWVWLYFLRREVLMNSGVRFPENALVKEDVVFDMNILPHLQKVAQGSYDGYRYRMRSNSLWHKPRSLDACVRFLDDALLFWKKQRELVSGYGISDIARAQVQKVLWCDLFEWVAFGVRDLRKHDSELILRYSLFGSEFGLYPQAPQFRWRLGVWVLRYFKSLKILYITHGLVCFVRRGLRG